MKKNNYSFSLFVIGSLFFVLGFVTWLNSILIPFLKLSCELTSFQSSFVTFAFYIAYFVMAIPSSYILERTGFGNGMSLGLIIMAIGALIFIPAAMSRSYLLFLIGLFTTGIGLSLLQTAVNPYTTIIGPLESAAKRISIMGICNKAAGMTGILLLQTFLFPDANEISEHIFAITNSIDKESALSALSYRVITPYFVIAAVLICLVLFIRKANLPEVKESDSAENTNDTSSLFSYPHLWLGILAIFFYVGAEVIAIDYLIPFSTSLNISPVIAAKLPILALIALVVGYIVSIIAIPKFISQRRALIIQLIVAIALLFVVIFGHSIYSITGVVLLSFAHAIMWPAIWPLSIRDLGRHTKLGSAILIMAISGGAVIPMIYGKLSDIYTPKHAIALLFVSYLYILFFAIYGYKIKRKS